jgi:hypothetical protein
MYLMHVVCFAFVALAMIVVTMATYHRVASRCRGARCDALRRLSRTWGR